MSVPPISIVHSLKTICPSPPISIIHSLKKSVRPPQYQLSIPLKQSVRPPRQYQLNNLSVPPNRNNSFPQNHLHVPLNIKYYKAHFKTRDIRTEFRNSGIPESQSCMLRWFAPPKNKRCGCTFTQSIMQFKSYSKSAF